MSIGRVVRPFRTFVRLLVKRDPVAGQKYSTSQVVPACSGGHFVFVWSVYGRERKNGASTCDLDKERPLLRLGALVLVRDELSLRANF